jgi:four helix bundle protein
MATTITSYRDLEVWNRAMDLAILCYRLTEKFPNTERFNLSSQIQRAAVSVPANIAEGHGRSHTGDFLHHLSIAYGSLMELETHFIIANELGFLGSTELTNALNITAEVSRMLSSLMKKLKERQTTAARS